MYLLSWNITIGKYKVQTMKSVKITTSVLNLSDTATIEMPGQYLSAWQKIEDKISVGDAVEIKLGYDNDNQTEFKGYLKRISRDNNSLVLECEDALYLLDKTVADKEYKSQSLNAILAAVLQQVSSDLTISCDYDYNYDKFIVFKQTALDVLKKIHEETKANIYFIDNVLHIHPVYLNDSGETVHIYDTQINVQSNDLKWIDKADRKVEIEVVFTGADGKETKQSYGNAGGEKIIKHVHSSTNASAVAEQEYNLWNFSGFEGNLTGWLIPATRAGDTVLLRDVDKAEGKYYVTGVEIEFGQSGAKRKVYLGRKLN